MKQMRYKVEVFIVPAGNGQTSTFKNQFNRDDSMQNGHDFNREEDDVNVDQYMKSHSVNITSEELCSKSSIYYSRNLFHSTHELTPVKKSVEGEKIHCKGFCYVDARNEQINELETNLSIKDKDSEGSKDSTMIKDNIDVDLINSNITHKCISIDSVQGKYSKIDDANNVHYSRNLLHRIHELSPIKESKEDDKVQHKDLCYHGCKNGCSAIVPTPQEVSENVFKHSWLQKLEDIKLKEMMLRNKEIVLQSREKALLKKEKELESLKNLLKEKAKQINLRLQEKDDIEEQTHTLNKETSDTNDDSEVELNNLDINKIDLPMKNGGTQSVAYEDIKQTDRSVQIIESVPKNLCEKKENVTNPPCPVLDNLLVEKRLKQLVHTQNYIAKSHRSKTIYNNNKVSRNSKICFDDLNSTLSADIGDSSFIQTSQKFDPMLYKKPYAFRRVASERHIKHRDQRSNMNTDVQSLSSQDESVQQVVAIKEDKILKKVTQNIFASQDKDTKFQHYGLIDHLNVASEVCITESENRYSYLNLEIDSKQPFQKLTKDVKERPMSWNEHTNEWLLKKRKAYNSTSKRFQTDNKENQLDSNKAKEKSEKALKKGDIKAKILTMFR